MLSAALICCTFVWDSENTCRWWVFSLSISKFSVCLVRLLSILFFLSLNYGMWAIEPNYAKSCILTLYIFGGKDIMKPLL
jgi:hypothetical protein